MKKRHKSTKFRQTPPLAGWTTLAMKTAAMMAASAEVIAARTQRLAAAPLPLTGKDAREAHRMVAEKAEAAVESARAVAMPLASQMIGLLPDMMHAAANPNPGNLGRLNRKLQRGALGLSAAAMAPFAKRARANARRLRSSGK